MAYKTKISKQGNDPVVKLPLEILDELGLVQGDSVTIELNGPRIEITRAEVDYNRATDKGRKRATRYRRTLVTQAE